MKKLFLLFLVHGSFISITSAQHLNDIDGTFSYAYKEELHEIIFSSTHKTYKELDANKNIVGQGTLDLKDSYFIITPTSIQKNATIDIPLKVKIIEVFPKKLKIEVYFPDRKSQMFSLFKL